MFYGKVWETNGFPTGIRSRNLFPTRKTGSFEAFYAEELICLSLCLFHQNHDFDERVSILSTPFKLPLF